MYWAWAQFENIEGETFRINTHVYLQPIAHPTSTNVSALQPIKLEKDKILPAVRNILIEVFNETGLIIIDNSYIQILDLIYLCDPLLDQAMIKTRKFLPNLSVDCSGNNEFPFVFYTLEKPDNWINKYKNRFINNIRTNNHIWFDYIKKETRLTKPTEIDFAWHIQVLRHNDIIQQIKAILLIWNIK